MATRLATVAPAAVRLARARRRDARAAHRRRHRDAQHLLAERGRAVPPRPRGPLVRRAPAR
eukprot:2161502-Prymnesium_polylepis.1